ncbi:Agamous-like MADS-box protein AGL80 [Carex littledalei]|uniref:Agamous-like MADS-box protein AGL80 n=1 Tax=Carex littledalei TaxID=544730 RepID=A0A833R9B4_9POAL|nr:Agamous-like MADS-box protein AGL80 [Carex littledalei]
MARIRKKVKLQYISNDALRRATLRKRSSSLLKKVEELSMLCGVHGCGIIYSPEEAAPQVWPQPQDARRTLLTFNSLHEVERTRKMTNHLAFMQERVGKLRNKVAVLRESDDFSEVSTDNLWAAGYALDDLISKVFERKCAVISLPPQAPIGVAVGAGIGRGVAVGPVAAPAVVAPGAPTTPTIAEAGPSTQAIRGGDGGEFFVEQMFDFGSSSDAWH